jgi:hypothetical protein
VKELLQAFAGDRQEVAADAALEPLARDLRLAHLDVQLTQCVMGFGKLPKALQGFLQILARRFRLAL